MDVSNDGGGTCVDLGLTDLGGLDEPSAMTSIGTSPLQKGDGHGSSVDDGGGGGDGATVPIAVDPPAGAFVGTSRAKSPGSTFRTNPTFTILPMPPLPPSSVAFMDVSSKQGVLPVLGSTELLVATTDSSSPVAVVVDPTSSHVDTGVRAYHLGGWTLT